MNKFAWLTDIHLNFLDKDERIQFYQEILNTQCTGVLITGDIAEAPNVVGILKEMENHIKLPIYFVLGNHDYYRGQVDEVRKQMTSLTQTHNQLLWLPVSGLRMLNQDTILVGQDGWADGRLGDYTNSPVSLNDSRLIVDLYQAKIYGKFKLLDKMQELADLDAKALENNLSEALVHRPKKIVVLTHVPPFREACTYEGKMSDDNWVPYFSSKATGDILLHIAESNSAVDFLVLCGHTHGKAHYQPLENLTIKAGHAEYYRPEIQELISL